MKKKLLISSILLVGMLVPVISCQRDWKNEPDKSGEMTVREARKFFESTAADLTLPGNKLMSPEGKAITRSATDGPLLVPQWDEAFRHKESSDGALEVPLLHGGLQAAVVRHRPGQQQKNRTEEVYSRLVFTQDPASGSIDYQVVTFIVKKYVQLRQIAHISH